MSQTQGTPDGGPLQVPGTGSVSGYDGILNGVLQDVRAVAKQRAGNLKPLTTIAQMGLDSLERMDIIARVESRFKVRIPELQWGEIETSHDLASAVERQLDEALPSANSNGAIPAEHYIFEQTPEYLRLQQEFAKVAAAGEQNPFFCEHDAISNHLTTIGNETLINYSGNNYLGMSGDPLITAASQAAIGDYGTSVSASRIVAGTRPIHTQLEQAICQFLDTPDAITFTAGHTTNAVVLGHLFGPDDLILHDELVHNSILVGCQISGAERRSFPHNDWQAAHEYLQQMRSQYRKVVIVIEGLYSMDGDYPDLPKFVEIKDRNQAWLYVDEAHSIGTLGATGRGLAEVYGVPRKHVDIWMGTLSKAIGACGGFITARESLVRYLKYTCPGVVFTIGLSPASCGAALAAFQMLQSDSGRVRQLQENSAYFLQQAREQGFDTGDSAHSPIVPVILGDSLRALQASQRMHQRGISVQPIMYPAVPNEKSRLRFFINSLHSREQMDRTVETLADVLSELGGG